MNALANTDSSGLPHITKMSMTPSHCHSSRSSWDSICLPIRGFPGTCWRPCNREILPHEGLRAAVTTGALGSWQLHIVTLSIGLGFIFIRKNVFERFKNVKQAQQKLPEAPLPQPQTPYRKDFISKLSQLGFFIRPLYIYAVPNSTKK